MKKLILLLFAMVIAVLSVFAQEQPGQSISGRLIDKVSEEPIPLANVRILRQSDSTFVTGMASDDNGHFNIPVNRGNYIVQISYIGYLNEYRNVQVTSSDPKILMGNISLTSDNILLSETVVTAKASEITVKGDTLEYNADSYKVTESAVVEDLLKKMPGVEIDSQGKITVNGKEISKILVDGEEFFSDDPKVASKNLPAKMVDKLQVLERKTEQAKMSGFDDGEEENVINLTVRPGMKEGLFGNAFAGYGSEKRYEANAMLNYMKDKDQYTFLGGINNTNNAGFSDLSSAMFGGMGGGMRRGGWGGNNGISTSGNTGGNFSKQFTPKLKLGGNMRYGFTDTNVNSDVFTQHILSAGNTLEKESNRSNNKSNNFGVDLRLEWEPDSSTLIIFRPSASFYDNQRLENGVFATQNELTGDTINHGDSEYYSQGKGRDLSFRFDASRELGKKGRILSVELRGQGGGSENDGNSVSSTFYNGIRPDDLIDQRFTNTSKTRSWRGYLSFVEPIGSYHFLQLAYQYRQNMSDSDRDTRIKDDAGNYTILDSLYSKRLENRFVRQEMEVNLKGVREKFDYMIGFSMQPSSSLSKTFIGEDMIYDGEQKVINYSPMAQFNYRWSRTHNMRLRYYGDTEQPSLTQLSPVVNVSSPLNISYGNPDLKPSFEHRFNIRYQRSNPEKASSFNTFINAGYMTNDIVTSSFTDINTGRRETTYRNVKGNWNANGRVMFNIPLGNIKFSLFSMSHASYSNTNGFSNNEKNTNKRRSLTEVLGLNYRSDQFDFAVRGNVNYNNVTNSLEEQQNQDYFNYGGNASTSIYLPWDLTLESDINYSTNAGYADGFEQNEWLWNASLQKTIFKQKNGTIRFKIYDILQQRSNISRSVTSNYIRDTTTNTLTSYFMFHFVYRFNFFKGGASQQDMMQQRGGRGGYGRGGGHGRM